MNAKLKGLIVICVHLGILILISVFWMRSIQNARTQKSQKLNIEIVRASPENELINEDDVKSHMAKFFQKDWRKVKIQSLNLKELESYFNKMSIVHHAEVFVDATEKMHVIIYQRDPILRVVDMVGNQFYIDIEGRKISNSVHYSARVPVATGQIPELSGNDIWKKGNEAYQQLFKVAKEISQDVFCKALIEQINLEPNQEVTLVPKIGNEKIMLGAIDELGNKLDKLKIFYQDGLPYQGWNVYQTIDLRNNNQVVCKKNINET